MSGAGLPTVSARRRSLVTATAAGAVLCALWFVPSAKATPDRPATGASTAGGASVSAPRALGAAHAPGAGADVPLDDPIGFGGTPYVLGGLGLAGAGGALVVRSRRRAQAPEAGSDGA